MTGARFDPYAVIRELERERVTYVVIGGLARVIRGSDELTRGTDLAPSPRPQNLGRLERALANLNARQPNRKLFELGALDPERELLLSLASDGGEIKIVFQPSGTRGYNDLRHRATREPIGEGLRPAVASADDLLRMLETLERPPDAHTIETMQRVLELDRGLSWGL